MTDFSGITITELAAIIAGHLQQQGIDVVLVGGLAVEIYTHNLYLTKDIDMVNTNYQRPQTLHKAMAELGFSKQGRVYVNATTDITVEFPPGPLSVGNELIRTTTVAQMAHGSIPILRVEDVIKDRLAAFIHWGDKQSLVQATAILLTHQLAPAAFQGFCLNEEARIEYQLLETLYQCANQKQLTTMEQLQTELTRVLLDAMK